MVDPGAPIQQREIALAVEAAARQREIDARWEAHDSDHSHHDERHTLEHQRETEVTRLEERSLQKAAEAHAEKHQADELAIRTALAAVKELADIHTKAHEREHANHEQRHLDGQEAVAKAEQSIDKRLEGMNEVRQQLRDQTATFASVDKLDTFMSGINQRFADTAKHTDDRYEDNRKRIEAIEKLDVKAEGKGLGQAAIVAIIVTAIGVVGTILSIVIVIANFATKAPL